MKESTLYPHVQRFLSSEAFGCFKTIARAGTQFIGIADLVGARDTGGDVRGDIEVVAVEVKLSTGNFGKILGQALGYSLFAHKCYLAVPFKRSESYSIEQKELATRLGVGLLRLSKYHATWRCTEILTSANHIPQGHQMEALLRKLWLARCTVCGVYADFENSGQTESWREALRTRKVYKVFREADRKLLFSKKRRGDQRRLYICNDCVKELWEGLIPS